MNGISGEIANTYILAKALTVALAVAIVAGAAAVWHCHGLSRDHASFYDVRSYGARGDGRGKDTAALQSTIDAAASHAGGTVLFPPRGYSRTPLLESRGTCTRNVEIVKGHRRCQRGSGFEVFDRSPCTLLDGSRLVMRDSTHSGRAPKSAGGIRVHPRLGS